MEYGFFGNSGLKVSVLSFGNWLTNKAEGYSADEAEKQLDI